MRKERVWMVQTEQQYICIYQCLLAVLEGKENIISPPREIHDNQGYEGTYFFFVQNLPHNSKRYNLLIKVDRDTELINTDTRC